MLREVNAAECYGDLRVDFCIDSASKYWFVNACSNDYLDFIPLDDFEESPYRAKYLLDM